MDARVLHRALLLAILAGLAFSAYAAFEVLNPALQHSCSISAFFSCSAVDRSGHTTVGAVSDWEIGLGGFGVMFALDVPLLRTYDPRLLTAVTVLALAGAVVAAGLAGVELFVIHALCPICLGAYLSDAAVLGIALALVWMRRAPPPVAPEPTGSSGAA